MAALCCWSVSEKRSRLTHSQSLCSEKSEVLRIQAADGAAEKDPEQSCCLLHSDLLNSFSFLTVNIIIRN